eukprot:1483621-Pyramimonas_sp.AAC.1
MDPEDTCSLDRVCTGKAGVCSRTLRRLIELSGRNDQNVLWSSIAQPYPSRLATALGKSLAAKKHASCSYNSGGP